MHGFKRHPLCESQRVRHVKATSTAYRSVLKQSRGAKEGDTLLRPGNLVSNFRTTLALHGPRSDTTSARALEAGALALGRDKEEWEKKEWEEKECGPRCGSGFVACSDAHLR